MVRSACKGDQLCQPRIPATPTPHPPHKLCEPRLKRGRTRWLEDPGAASRLAFRSSLDRGKALGTMSPPVEQGPRGDRPYPSGGSLSRALIWRLRLVPCSGCPWMELLISFSFQFSLCLNVLFFWEISSTLSFNIFFFDFAFLLPYT